MDVKHAKSSSSSGLPMARVKIIMKSSPDVEHISPDALFSMTKATELFVSHISSMAFKMGDGTSPMEYKSLANVVNSDDSLGFLQEVIPHKIKAQEYFELIKSRRLDEDEDSSDD